MRRLLRTTFSLLAVMGLLLSSASWPGRAARAEPLAGASLTVDTGNNSNSADNELSLFEALNTVTGAKNACFSDHEKAQISGVSWLIDPFTCGQSVGTNRWNINPLSSLYPAVIHFSDAVSDVTVNGALPAIATLTTLDGSTHGGSSKVRLLKSGGYTGPGLVISGCLACSLNVYIHNLKIEGFTSDGITNFNNGLVDSNFLGLEILNNGGNGISLSYGDTKNPRNISIGGPNAADGNLIYHNGGAGISIKGTTAADLSDFNLLIQGNRIGMDAAGTALGNLGNGIVLNNTRGVSVGGANSSYANIIVHNGGNGVQIQGAALNNLVSNNFIGAESGGPLDRGNTGSGVALLAGANHNTVFTNLISGNNGAAGVLISGSGTSANTIQANGIGLGANSSLGNLGEGVLISDLASANLLTGNGIGWNGLSGVHITSGASANQVFSNYIGVNSTFIVGNSSCGVLIDGGAHNNQAGAAGTGNYIGSNASDGVRIQGSGSDANSVYANWIGLSNTNNPRPNHNGVAVLDGAAHNAIGTAGAGNTIVSNSGAGVLLSGAFTSANTVYANWIGISGAGLSGYGNGGAGVQIISAADSNNVGSGSSQGNVISGNSGPGVDITSSGNVVADNLIGTNLAGSAAVGNAGGGVRVTGGQSNFIGYLNVISGNSGDGVLLDANSDNNYVLGNTVGLNAARTARLGNSASGISIRNLSSGNLIGTGGAANVIAANGGLGGVYITDGGSDNNTITANFIGTNELSAAGLGNSGAGVMVTNGAYNTTIGSDVDAGQRNIISGNAGSGVLIMGATTSQVSVVGNYIGTVAAGTLALPNGAAGVTVNAATHVTIGGTGSSVVQCISGNSAQGIFAQATQYLKVLGGLYTQFIGNQCLGAFAGIGNGQQGILLDNTLHSTIMPFAVTYNGGAGIAVTGASAQANLLKPVLVFGNGGLPIDLGNNGFSPNDINDLDSGPNGLLNYPEVKAISGNTLSGTACASCTIFIYKWSGDPTQPGGGAQLQTQVAFSNASGAWSVTLSNPLTPYTVTLQACQAANCVTNPDANSSELSPRIYYWRVYLPLARR